MAQPGRVRLSRKQVLETHYWGYNSFSSTYSCAITNVIKLSDIQEKEAIV
jgi:hypothetical protein